MAADMTQTLPLGVEYVRILPEIVLSLFGMAIMLLDPLVDERSSQRLLGLLAFIGAVAAIVATIYQSQYPGVGFWGMVKIDSFSTFFHVVVTAITAVVILTSYEYMEVQRIRAGEYYGLILFGAVGMCLMSSAVELVLIFIALEISSISTYVLAGFRRRAAISSESSLKYFLLGSFATAFFLYGVALMFGATGSTSIAVIAQTLRSGPIPVLAYAGIALMFVGLGFKVAAAPFHVWTPDVYEGAPAPVVGFMSTAPKAAVFAVLLRIMFEVNAPGRLWLIWVVGGALHDFGQCWRTGATECEAFARLFFHCPCRLYSRCLCLIARQWNSGCNVLYGFLRRHECWRVRGSQSLCRRGGAAGHAGRLCRAGKKVASAGRYANDFSAFINRNSDDWRFLCQVLRVQRRIAGKSGWTHNHRRA